MPLFTSTFTSGCGGGMPTGAFGCGWRFFSGAIVDTRSKRSPACRPWIPDSLPASNVMERLPGGMPATRPKACRAA